MVNGTVTGSFQAITHVFHDDSIYGMTMVSPDPDNDDWVSELQLDIDHIDDWIRGEGRRFRFCLRIPMKPDGVSNREAVRDSDLMPDSQGFVSLGRDDHR